MARTFAYDNSPRPKAAVAKGSFSKARATCTCSRAVRAATPHFHVNHCDVPRHSHDSYNARRSNSATINKKRHIPEFIGMCEANVNRPKALIPEELRPAAPKEALFSTRFASYPKAANCLKAHMPWPSGMLSIGVCTSATVGALMFC